MKERGIIFNAEMVRAILSGQKTQTRRVCKPMQQWVNKDCREVRTYDGSPHHFMKGADLPIGRLDCPFGQVGDRLWVRETSGIAVRRDAMGGSGEFRVYRASDPGAVYCTTADGGSIPIKWIPSIHMPRKASRILLEITCVRVEKLNDISEADAQAEGITFTDYGLSRFRTQKPGWFWRKSSSSDECLSSAYWAFCNLWTNVYGEESWRSNPWVWVIEFKRVEGGAA